MEHAAFPPSLFITPPRPCASLCSVVLGALRADWGGPSSRRQAAQHAPAHLDFRGAAHGVSLLTQWGRVGRGAWPDSILQQASGLYRCTHGAQGFTHLKGDSSHHSGTCR